MTTPPPSLKPEALASLVERLKAYVETHDGINQVIGCEMFPHQADVVEAATTIETLEADVAALREALERLEVWEAAYRQAHDLHGDGSMQAGRAWDQMRRAGNHARTTLERTAR